MRCMTVRTETTRVISDFRQLCDFVIKMRKGDRVFVKRGTREIVGYGLVASDYFFDQARAEYRHLRSATWQKDGVWTIPDSEKALPVKTLTEVKDPARLQSLLALISNTGAKSGKSRNRRSPHFALKLCFGGF